MSQTTVNVEKGHKATVHGVRIPSDDFLAYLANLHAILKVIDADFYQRATLSIKNELGRVIALTTFVGQGANVPATQESHLGSSTWCFGPFEENVSLDVLIEHSPNGDIYKPSKIMTPVHVNKQADGSHPAAYHLTTILSEDNDDNDYNDCILNIFQYK
ncbi:hypothetical protein H0H93_003240 [Arthromyces matolae]|nr:hypothetical protein H0H93_003240 [Arthromyces matolae]